MTLGSGMALRGLRGATTCSANTVVEIEQAVSELMDALVEHNGLEPESIVSITFSVTTDLNACFPAAIARRRQGWDGVALIDCQQMAVEGDLERCIRILAHTWMPEERELRHAYLGKASRLRPDRSGHN